MLIRLHTAGEIIMNNDTCISVVSSLFDFHAGKFYNLDVSGEMAEMLDVKGKVKGLVIDTWRGREMTVFGFTEDSIHGQLLIRRWPIDKKPDLKTGFYEVLKELISVAVLTIKAIPEKMVTRTLWKDSRLSDWEDSDGDILGVVISAGLLSRHATFCIGAGEFSVYYDNDEIISHHFKPPHYIDNIFYLPVKRR
jgi:hypothetical protein